MNNVLIRVEELKALREAAEELQALQNGGVDNWDGYDFALEELWKVRAREEILEGHVTNLLEELSEHIDAPAGHEAGYSICGDKPYDIVKRFLKIIQEDA